MISTHNIRKLNIADLPEAIELVWKVFVEFEAPDFSDEGIKEFKSGLGFPEMQEKLQKCEWIFWGCFMGNQLVGMAATRQPCHISLLFVDKDFHKQGIAKALIKTALKSYKEAGHNAVTVNSSPYAVEIYKRMGFEATDTEQVIKGMRFTPMTKELKGYG